MKKLSENLTSQEFKKAAQKAIFAIIFFIISYLILLLLAIGLAALCGFLGIMLISVKIHWLTLMLGLGLIGMGLIVLIFLVKFIFKRHKIDRSHLIEIKEADAPLLYQSINEIVHQVRTDFPKKIYISHEVNASVFYDSTFLSMIFPVRKNLQIGMGLVNSVSKNELKAILAHEFGHFSQRSMKVGSYVYTVNQIIYNMLYDNESYGRLISWFASISNYFSFFVSVGIKIIEGVQWILRKLYNVVNLQHLKLSREMEFHADAIAVNIMGTKPFTTSMMRLDLANNSYDNTIRYYEAKIDQNIKPNNIYPQHQFVMNDQAKEANMMFVNGLPNVTTDDFYRYNKSKLVIKNQWASHPSTEDRINAVNNGQYPLGEDDGKPATTLFLNIEKLQATVTDLLFANTTYKANVVTDTLDEFESDYLANFKAKPFPKIFNGYYDHHNPLKVDSADDCSNEKNFDSLYDTCKVELLYRSFSIEADINTLKQIQSGEIDIKSFEYDGVKYQKNDIYDLLPILERELEETKATIETNDKDIYGYFSCLPSTYGPNLFNEKYKAFLQFDHTYDEAAAIYSKAITQTRFIQYTTPFAEIEASLKDFSATELELKAKMRELLSLSEAEEVKADTKQKILSYVEKEKHLYFNVDSYVDSELDILFFALNAYLDLLNQIFLYYKKKLLEEMERLQLSVTQV
jgi:Zn-dependent protease with chaperone function